MPTVLEVASTMTDHCEIMLTRAEDAEGRDPLLGRLRDFLARDIASYPERLQTLEIGLAQRLNSLISGTEADLDAAPSAEND